MSKLSNNHVSLEFPVKLDRKYRSEKEVMGRLVMPRESGISKSMGGYAAYFLGVGQKTHAARTIADRFPGFMGVIEQLPFEQVNPDAASVYALAEAHLVAAYSALQEELELPDGSNIDTLAESMGAGTVILNMGRTAADAVGVGNTVLLRSCGLNPQLGSDKDRRLGEFLRRTARTMVQPGTAHIPTTINLAKTAITHPVNATRWIGGGLSFDLAEKLIEGAKIQADKGLATTVVATKADRNFPSFEQRETLEAALGIEIGPDSFPVHFVELEGRPHRSTATKGGLDDIAATLTYLV